MGVDNNQPALDTFELNHDGAVALNADLSDKRTLDMIVKIAADRSIDVSLQSEEFTILIFLLFDSSKDV